MNIFSHGPLLSMIIFVPMGAALVVLAVNNLQFARRFSLGVTLFDLFFGVIVFMRFSGQLPGFQFVENTAWIPSIGARYQLGLDGLSIGFFLGTLAVAAVTIAACYFFEPDFSKTQYASLLVLFSTTLGMFAATDMLLFIMFFSGTLVPAYFLAQATFGGRTEHSGTVQLMFQLAGTLFVMLAFIAIHALYFREVNQVSFDWETLRGFNVSITAQKWLFAGLLMGFSIRGAMFPFHGWLPESLARTGTPLTMFTLSMGIKIGVYGIMRFCIPFCADAVLIFAQAVIYMAIIGIVYGALVALMQTDVQKVVISLVVSQTGFLYLGIFTLVKAGILGSVVYAASSAFATAVLFFTVQWLRSRYDTLLVLEFSGVQRRHPLLSRASFLAALMFAGMPGFINFPGIFLILMGTVTAQPVWAAIAAIGFILGTGCILWLFQRVFLGKESSYVQQQPVTSDRKEFAVFLLMSVVAIGLGLFPQPLVGKTNVAVSNLSNTIESHRILQQKQPDMENYPSQFKGIPPERLKKLLQRR